MTAAPAPDRDRLGRAAAWAVALIGIVLIAWQYAGGASLWVDELALARNVLDRGWMELLAAPLSDAQVAPLGFLALEKLATGVFGDSDRALRVVPFVCAIGAVVVFTRVALGTLGSKGAFLAVAVVALSARLIWNGSQAKQYAGDVLVSAAVLWMVPWVLAAPSRRRCAIAAALGAGAAFLSQPGAFVLAAGAVAIIVTAWAAPPADRRRAASAAVAWLAAAGVAGLVARATVAPETMRYMRDFWASGFAPYPPRSAGDLLWPWTAIRMVFAVAINTRGLDVYVGLSVLGGLVLMLRRRAIGLVVVGAVLLGMAAAVAQLYPFVDRPAVYTIPLLALACGAAADAVADLIGRRMPRVAWIVPLLLGAAPVRQLVRRPPVYRIQEARPLLDWFASRRRDGDGVYVFYGAWQAMRHYGPRVGMAGVPVVWGRCHRGAPRAYYRELDALRGRSRVWILFSHVEPRFQERDAILGYLDAIGERRESRTIPDPYVRSIASVDAHLYDLSDPGRLASTDAERAVIPPGSDRRSASGQCRGPVIPDERWLRGSDRRPG